MSLLTRLFNRGQEDAVPDGSDAVVESSVFDDVTDEPTNVDDAREVTGVDTEITEEQQPATTPSVPSAIARFDRTDTEPVARIAPPPPIPHTPPPIRPTPSRAPTRRAAPPPAPVARAEMTPDPAPVAAAGSDIDEAFERLLTPVDGMTFGDELTPAPEPAPGILDGSGEARKLFEEIAVHHAAQIRDFMLEVRIGSAPTEWIEMCEAVVASLRSASEQLEMGPLGEALDGFANAIAAARAGAGSSLNGAARDTLNAAYAPLVEAMPGVFALDAERNRREPIIVRSLLLQVEGVHEVAVRKIYQAGLTGLDAILGARPGDLADASGIPLAMAERVVDRFRAYKRDAATTVAARFEAEERGALAGIVNRLSECQRQLEDASAGWSDDHLERKRRARADRSKTMLEVRVALARLGAVDLADEIEKLPFQRRIEQLTSYLAD
jgi:hypothetical protein